MKVFTCPVCGGEVDSKARACPHCGSDEKTGWSESTYLDGIDLYDDGDYEETIRREFGVRRTGLSKKQVLVSLMAIVFLILFLLRYVLRLF